MIDKKQLALVADLILQKIEQINDPTRTGIPEKAALTNYLKDINEILNTELAIWFAENILAAILRGTIVRIDDEFSKINPDKEKIQAELNVVMNFLSEVVGIDKYDYLKLTPKEVKEDFDRLEEDLREITEMFSKTVSSDDDSYEIKNRLEELKKEFKRMKKENDERE